MRRQPASHPALPTEPSGTAEAKAKLPLPFLHNAGTPLAMARCPFSLSSLLTLDTQTPSHAGSKCRRSWLIRSQWLSDFGGWRDGIPEETLAGRKKPLVVITRKLPDQVETRMRELFDARLHIEDRPMNEAELAKAMQEADVLVPTITDKIDAALIAKPGQT
jgi:hypothetical protein